MTKMDKEYIEREYEQAIKEYNTALTEDDMDNARRTMKRLEAIAMQEQVYTMYQKAQDNFIDPGLLSLLKRKIIPGQPGAVDGRQL